MIAFGDWRAATGEVHLPERQSAAEFPCWQDSASPLQVSRIGAADSDIYRLRIGGDLVVDVDAGYRRITRAFANLPQETIDHFLVDIVLPRLLSHDGELVVHAGGVGIGDGGLMLMGLSGHGKSTLATSFYRAGFDLLGDDAMIISAFDAAPLLRAVYPSLRLFSDSMDALIPDGATAEPVSPQSPKHRIDLKDYNGIDDPIPLRAIFLIGDSAGDHIVVQRLSLAETCMAVVKNSFALDPSDTGRASARLRAASTLARQVPAFEIRYPRDYARLPEVRQAILDQVAALERA